jgi:hypothetical protein
LSTLPLATFRLDNDRLEIILRAATHGSMSKTLRQLLDQWLRKHLVHADAKSVLDIWNGIACERRLMSPTQEAEDEDDEDEKIEDMKTDYGENTDESDGEDEADDSNE